MAKRAFGEWVKSTEWDRIRYLIDSSVVFNINNVFTYIQNKANKTLTYFDVPNVRPPYPIMWLEWPESYEWGAVLNGIVVQSEWDEERNTGFSFAHMFIRDNNRKVMPFAFTKWEWDATGTLLLEGVMPSSGTNNKDQENIINAAHNNLLPPMMAISLMHCKNVILIDNSISEKLQKARENHGKLPLVSFKTLEIKPMVKILREEGQSEIEGLKRALHICRGHFKDYSKGNGLFGRDKGMYWWESQVRGNVTQGISLKDYKVSPN